MPFETVDAYKKLNWNWWIIRSWEHPKNISKEKCARSLHEEEKMNAKKLIAFTTQKNSMNIENNWTL